MLADKRWRETHVWIFSVRAVENGRKQQTGQKGAFITTNG